MTRIKCNREDCVHNHLSHCILPQIRIDDIAICSSYSKYIGERTFEEYSRLNEEYGRENDESINDDHFVECDSINCISNYSGQCIINKIKIDKKKEEAICSSYQTR